ncbi:quinohemoprotein amine dehydrogenase subunit alpha [Gluconacetobacter sp. Hr-1-5]|uniref:quinohemoprotein amine dehydrogenase subunit alpha n=1 Tax=Gluconacetobacter sp. Hr-1-5 TaxID=3395370 RepID=UPI003B5274FD
MRFGFAFLIGGLCATSVALAAPAPNAEAGKDPADQTETEVGIPVASALVREKCGSCHTPDDKGDLSRISWVRATPEGWAQTLKRMVKLNGLSITPDEARSVVRYLSTYQGLAPDEAKPVMYLAEHRDPDETIIPNETLRQTCASCHAFAQPMSSRRSHREWALLENMHKALYSTAQAIYDAPSGGAQEGSALARGAGDEDKKSPPRWQVALDWLSANAPLHTAEWAAWRPGIHAPHLGGKWLVSAVLPGHGRFVGEMVIAPGPGGADEFTTTTTLRSIDGGEQVVRKGVGLVYAGYSWRGTSQGGTKPVRPDDMPATMRETMWFAPDQATAMGRWYWGEYHEFGFDVTMTRETGGAALVAASEQGLRIGTNGVRLRLFGANLPTDLKAADIDLGAGVTVRQVVSATPDEAVIVVDVAGDAIPGPRDIAMRGAVLRKGISVYAHVDYIKVAPETALARLGGIKFGKGYQQFTAIGWSNGADGKPGTQDDFAVGTVPATWSLAEFATVSYDDDISFVGTLDPKTGLFTPNVEGPDPKRRFSRNNYGDVWVVATAKDDRGKALTGRAFLVTTVPAYKRWDQPEVSR